MAERKSSSVLGALVQTATLAVTQGSADAFATVELATGISTAAKFAWLIERVEFAVSAGIVAAPQTADCDLIIQIAQGVVPAALKTPDDDDLICEWRSLMPGIASAVNAYLLPGGYTWWAPENFVVVDPALHLIVDSSATAVANTGYARIFYYPVELSELDILRMIALR